MVCKSHSPALALQIEIQSGGVRLHYQLQFDARMEVRKRVKDHGYMAV